jgi:hypothetical protein
VKAVMTARAADRNLPRDSCRFRAEHVKLSDVRTAGISIRGGYPCPRPALASPCLAFDFQGTGLWAVGAKVGRSESI